MKIKTAELTGAALDRAVVIALGYEIDEHKCAVKDGVAEFNLDFFSPSEVWAQGGPIIDRELLCLNQDTPRKQWVATTNDAGLMQFGLTPLLAAMRCYVASKLGDELDVPDELINN